MTANKHTALLNCALFASQVANIGHLTNGSLPPPEPTVLRWLPLFPPRCVVGGNDIRREIGVV
jgi:hypothetical protein